MVIGPTPPGTGVMAPANSSHFSERHIADDLRLAVPGRNAVYADVDDSGARLDPIAAYHLRLANCCEDDVPTAAHGSEVARLRMRDRHCRIIHQQQLRERLADDVRAPDHDRFKACERPMHFLGEHDAGKRRARHDARKAGR